jgi:hypothetical protein
VETIGESVFSGCAGLTDITFLQNSHLRSIGNWAFWGTGLTDFVAPISLEVIGEYAFVGAPLTSIIFLENSHLTKIDTNAFLNCEQLASITIPNSENVIKAISETIALLECPLKTVKVICQTPDRNNIDTIKLQGGRWINSLQVALAPSLVERQSSDELKLYVQGILNLPGNLFLTYSVIERSGFCELDLSNTDLTKRDIDDMEKSLTCPWKITFRDGTGKMYNPG